MDAIFYEIKLSDPLPQEDWDAIDELIAMLADLPDLLFGSFSTKFTYVSYPDPRQP